MLDPDVIRQFGPFQSIEDSPGEHSSQVSKAVTARGETVFIKRLSPRKFQQESVFYKNYSLPNSPRLLADYRHSGTLVLSECPGTPVGGDRRNGLEPVYREAGRQLKRIHQQEPYDKDNLPLKKALELRLKSLKSQTDMHPEKREIEQLLAGTGELLDASRVNTRVPCHRDFMEHNWLLSEQGDLFIIDFEHARSDFWLLDLCQMNALVWSKDRELKRAFLQGYGTSLEAWEESFLHLWSLVWSYGTLFWARTHDDERYQDLATSALRALNSRAT